MTWLIYKKELKESLVDRKTIFLSLIIPIFLNSAFVLFYEYMFFSPRQPEQVVVAINETVDTNVYTMLSEMENITWLKVPDPKVAAIEGKSLLGVVVEAGFTEHVAHGESSTITILSDLTSQKASRITEEIEEHLNSYKEKIVEQRLVRQGIDPQLVAPFDLVEESLRAKDDLSLMMVLILLPMLVMLYVVMGGVPVAIDLFSGEKEHKTMEAILLTPVSRTKLVLAKWLTVGTFGMMAGIISVLSFTITTKLFTERMAASFDYGKQTLLILLFAFIAIMMLSLLSAVVIAVVSLLAKSYKEAQAYTAPITFLAMGPYFMMVTMSPNEIPAHFYWLPFINIFAMFKELLYGITSYTHLALCLLTSFMIMGLMFFILDRMIKNERWVLGK